MKEGAGISGIGIVSLCLVLQQGVDEEAYQQRKAEAATVEAQKRIDELELHRQQDLDWFQNTNQATVTAFFLQLCVRALPLGPFMTSSADGQASQQEQHSKGLKAGKERPKQEPRFL